MMMSPVDGLMSIVAVATVALFAWLEVMRRKIVRLDAQIEAREREHHAAE
jgi:hypothetical protein